MMRSKIREWHITVIIQPDASVLWTVPAGAALIGLATASSSSLLDSSLLELSALFLTFLANGPFVASLLLGGAFRFLASGDLRRTKVVFRFRIN